MTLSYISFTDIPSCWPRSLKTLSFVDAPLTSFESKNKTQPITWPENLSFLSIKTYGFTDITRKVFENAPANFTKVIINECTRPFDKFFSHWPSTGTLKSLYFRNCYLNSTQPSDFINLQQLRVLDFSGNKLTTVPEGLPQSLQTLFLSRNSIEFTDRDTWKNLKNLKTLDMQNNRLRYVPSNLPEKLEVLILNNNMIVFSDSAAFAHLSQLSQASLGNNKYVKFY